MAPQAPGGSPVGVLEVGPYVVTLKRPQVDETLAFKGRMHPFYLTFPSRRSGALTGTGERWPKL